MFNVLLIAQRKIMKLLFSFLNLLVLSCASIYVFRTSGQYEHYIFLCIKVKEIFYLNKLEASEFSNFKSKHLIFIQFFKSHLEQIQFVKIFYFEIEEPFH